MKMVGKGGELAGICKTSERRVQVNVDCILTILDGPRAC